MTVDRAIGPTDDLITRLVDTLKNSGLRLNRIVYIYDIDEETLKAWLRAGRTVIKELRDPTSPYELQCFKLVMRVERAESELEDTLVSQITNASGEDWRAAQFLLQSRFAKDWAPKTTLKIDESNKIDVSKMSSDELQKFIASKQAD